METAQWANSREASGGRPRLSLLLSGQHLFATFLVREVIGDRYPRDISGVRNLIHLVEAMLDDEAGGNVRDALQCGESTPAMPRRPNNRHRYFLSRPWLVVTPEPSGTLGIPGIAPAIVLERNLLDVLRIAVPRSNTRSRVYLFATAMSDGSCEVSQPPPRASMS